MPVEKVAIVTPEYYGSAMVGGLAMATHGLAHALKEKGIDVRVIMPDYPQTGSSAKFIGVRQEQDGESFRVSDVDGIRIYHIKGSLGYPDSYKLSSPNPYIEDSAYRKATLDAYLAARILSMSVPIMLEKIKVDEEWEPDAVHLHEWQLASASRHLREQKNMAGVPVVVTTHNANYIGEVPNLVTLPDGVKRESPLGISHATAIQDGDEFFGSLLEMGIFFSDAVTTVSPTYRNELIDGNSGVNSRVVRRMSDRGLVGILNGVDYKLFDPEHDEYVSQFNPHDMESVAYGKGANKVRLHREFGIQSTSDVMQITMMSRLAHQKGIDLVISAANMINELEGVQLLIVGESTEVPLRGQIEGLGGNIRGVPNFVGPELQHLVLAGSDAILMPSIYEPCGYTQLEGVRYGAVPIATHVGGLADTVQPFDGQHGYGYVINEPTRNSIVDAIRRAFEDFRSKDRWRVAIGNAMAEDFSWDGPRNSVGKYIDLYNEVIEQRRKSQH